MASWMTYARKILTSVAGELEKTAQEFNDAIHSLSAPKPTNGAGSESSGDYDHPPYSAATCPQSLDSLDAGSIPEYLRGVSGSLPVIQTSQESNTQICNSSITTDSRFLHLSSRSSVGIRPFEPTKDKGSGFLMSPDQVHEDTSSPLVASVATTATTCQPEPIGVFSSQSHPLPPIHKRWSQSSPSLSPISHEKGNGLSSDVADSYSEDLDSLTSDICETELLRFRTSNTRLYNDEHIKPLPLSVSTPCLVNMQKILPSCLKKFKCPSSSFSPQKAYSNNYRSSTISRMHKRDTYFSYEYDENREGDILEETRFRRTNTQPSGNIVSSKQPLTSLGSKRPGRVVMVVSQPDSCKDTGFPEEQQLPYFDTKMKPASEDCLYTEVASIQLGVTESNSIVGDDNHQSKKDRDFLQAAQPTLKIERHMQQTHWRMLAPLARVLTFAYSQVVNAMFLLQTEESSVSSGNNRSRASSFSKDISSSHSISPTKCFTKANLDTPQPITSFSNGRHKRQMSQISLAGSALSSDSFEVLDVSDMEASNFVFIGHESSDILHEHHLFPSKPTLITRCAPSEQITSTTHSGAIFTTPLPVYSLGAEDTNIMSSSSADFAHFDFKELISDRQDNQLNPLVVSDTKNISALNQICGMQKEASNSVNDAMLQSFVYLDRSRSPVPVCNSNLDNDSFINLPQKSLGGFFSKSDFDEESQSSFSVVSESEFQLKAY